MRRRRQRRRLPPRHGDWVGGRTRSWRCRWCRRGGWGHRYGGRRRLLVRHPCRGGGWGRLGGARGSGREAASASKPSTRRSGRSRDAQPADSTARDSPLHCLSSRSAGPQSRDRRGCGCPSALALSGSWRVQGRISEREKAREAAPPARGCSRLRGGCGGCGGCSGSSVEATRRGRYSGSATAEDALGTCTTGQARHCRAGCGRYRRPP